MKWLNSKPNSLAKISVRMRSGLAKQGEIKLTNTQQSDCFDLAWLNVDTQHLA